MHTHDVVVVGGGQAGLAVSHELRDRGVEHVVLEARSVAQTWRDRWDSLTLVTPNWTLDLPGAPYAGDDPEGHVPVADIVGYLEDYAAGHAGEIRTGCPVSGLTPDAEGWELDTPDGPVRARSVVVCSGAYQQPQPPPGLAGSDLPCLDATTYRNPGQVPDGRVLVVGSGQSGIQIAEELHEAGREVIISCGRAPWAPRRIGDVDIVTWLARTPFFDMTLAQLPSPAARLAGNVQSTGAAGGHDLNHRVLQSMGVRLAGHVRSVDDGHVRFADDLEDSVAFGDARFGDLRRMLLELPELSESTPELALPPPFVAEPLPDLRVADLSAVVVTTGFRPDYGWVHAPVFDQLGFPVTDDECRAAPGLWFCGVHFIRTRRSALLFGVGDDAAVVADSVAGDLRAA
jgi:putative flavoprotein involved in K+ transport